VINPAFIWDLFNVIISKSITQNLCYHLRCSHQRFLHLDSSTYVFVIHHPCFNDPDSNNRQVKNLNSPIFIFSLFFGYFFYPTFSVLFSRTINLCCFIRLRNQTFHPQNGTVKVVFLYKLRFANIAGWSYQRLNWAVKLLDALLWGAFAKLQRASIRFITSLCPSVCPSVLPHGANSLPLDEFS